MLIHELWTFDHVFIIITALTNSSSTLTCCPCTVPRPHRGEHALVREGGPPQAHQVHHQRPRGGRQVRSMAF